MKRILLLILCFWAVTSSAQEIPKNAHKNTYGTGWECDRGYYKSGNNCLPVQIPENAQLNYYGHGWECKRGFYKSRNRCLSVQIPKNAQLNYYGHGWDCKRGFYKSGNKCLPVQIPKNAGLDYYGHGWKCARGFERIVNECVKFSIPNNASIRPDGNGWTCNLNYKRSGKECIPMTNQELAYQNLLIMRARACGKSYNYDVTGYCGGEYVYGNVDACSNSKDVTGYVTFDNGAEMDFEGEWVSKGVIEGTDGFGNSCDLEID